MKFDIILHTESERENISIVQIKRTRSNPNKK